VASGPSDPTLRYTYDPRSRRYRDLVTGQYVSASQVRGAVDYVVNAVSDKLRATTQLLIDGALSVADWEIQVAAMLKSLHIAMGLAAYGGISGANQKAMDDISARIEKQYEFLSNLAGQIASGKQALDGTLLARIALYGQAGRGTYENIIRDQAMNDPNLTEEQRVLGANDSCPTCLDQAALGWQPLGTLNAIGDSECLANCRCSFQYR
jgi:hypothetical protein